MKLNKGEYENVILFGLSFIIQIKTTSFSAYWDVNKSFMQATYSFPEIKSMVRSLDCSAINILEELIEEEKECFSAPELRALHRFLYLKNKHAVGNEVRFEYLLSFN